MLDLHRLQLLHHFSQQGSIAATAAATRYSASAVSQQLATLEREVGAALLDRTARSAELTMLGHRLAEHAATILEAVEAAEVDLATHVGRAAGRVRIAAVPTAAIALGPALAELRADHPDVEVTVRQASPDDALIRLRAREVDIAVIDDHSISPPARHPRLTSEVLLLDPFVLCLPRPRASTGEEPPSPPHTVDGPPPSSDHPGVADLGRHAAASWICAPDGEPSRIVFDRVLADVGLEPTTRWEFEGLATIATLVSQGVGIAVLPRLAVSEALTDRLILQDLPMPAARAIVAVTRSSSRSRPSIDVALSALRAAVGTE